MYCQWSLFHLNSRTRRENPTCVTFTILDICRSVQQVFIFFPTSASQHPLQVWKDKKSHVASLPLSISPHTVARPHGLVCPGVTCCRSVEGGSSNRARCLSWKTRGCFYFSEHILRFPLAAESFDLWKGKVWGVAVKGLVRLGPHRRSLAALKVSTSSDGTQS